MSITSRSSQVSEDGFNTFNSNNPSNVANQDKPINPKSFCDSVYMRLMNVLFVISDEKQAAATQQQFNSLVKQIEGEVINK